MNSEWNLQQCADGLCWSSPSLSWRLPALSPCWKFSTATFRFWCAARLGFLLLRGSLERPIPILLSRVCLCLFCSFIVVPCVFFTSCCRLPCHLFLHRIFVAIPSPHRHHNRWHHRHYRTPVLTTITAAQNKDGTISPMSTIHFGRAPLLPARSRSCVSTTAIVVVTASSLRLRRLCPRSRGNSGF